MRALAIRESRIADACRGGFFDSHRAGVRTLAAKKLDDEVTPLHLDKIGVKLTTLTKKLGYCLDPHHTNELTTI